MKPLIIGTRGSALALWQANYIKNRLQNELGLSSEIKIVKTKGDKILDVPLAKIGGKGLFTKELEELLLKKEIDLAVHSLKDVPVDFTPNLGLACITKREDVRDCFLSKNYSSLKELPLGARIGTTSLRRSMQLKAMRKDFDTLSLRGNVQTRIQRLQNGDFDAIILAFAGLKRLGLDSTCARYVVPIEIKEMIPAMGQAALGIECRLDDEIYGILQNLGDEKTTACANAEREFVRILEGGCQAPIGVHCALKDSLKNSQNKLDSKNALKEGNILISAIVGLADGSEILRDEIEGDFKESLVLTRKLAQRMIANGAREILQRSLDLFK